MQRHDSIAAFLIPQRCTYRPEKVLIKMSTAAIRRKWKEKERMSLTGCTHLESFLGGIEAIGEKGSLDASFDHRRRLLLFVAV